MVTSSFQPFKNSKKNIKRHRYLIVPRKQLLYVAILIAICVSYNPVNSQTFKQITDTIRRTNINFLQNKRGLSEQYRKSVVASSKVSLNESLVPFYPYVTINFGSQYLNSTPRRVYLGKSSIKDLNDYVLIIAPCQKSLAGKASAKNNYTDINTGLSRVMVKGANWYSVKVSRLNDSRDVVSYTPIDWKTAREYVHNFDTVTTRYGLAKRYRTCFVIESVKSSSDKNNNRIILQPVIRAGAGASNTGGGSKSFTGFRKFMFIDNYGMQDPEGKATICCEAPPENGNSITN